jgi:hypothetical protein
VAAERLTETLPFSANLRMDARSPSPFDKKQLAPSRFFLLLSRAGMPAWCAFTVAPGLVTLHGAGRCAPRRPHILQGGERKCFTYVKSITTVTSKM